MKKTSLLFLFIGLTAAACSQKKQPFSGHIAVGANIMAYDRFIQYTHAGAGAGVQLCYAIRPKLKAQFDISGSMFSTNKILFVFENGETAAPAEFVLATMAGLVYSPVKNVETGIAAGPSFVEGAAYAAVKPCLGYYFGKRQRVKSLVSLTHVFEKNSISKKNMGFISTGLSLQLF